MRVLVGVVDPDAREPTPVAQGVGDELGSVVAAQRTRRSVDGHEPFEFGDESSARQCRPTRMTSASRVCSSTMFASFKQHLGQVRTLVERPIALAEVPDDLLGSVSLPLHRDVLLPSMLESDLTTSPNVSAACARPVLRLSRGLSAAYPDLTTRTRRVSEALTCAMVVGPDGIEPTTEGL
jgi:hypothetical protein